MEGRNPNKRLRQVSSSTGQNRNPNSPPSVSGFNQNHVDLIISSFLSLPDLPSLSSSLSISDSFDRALDKHLEALGDDESVQDLFTERGLLLASLLHESTKRCSQKRATLHNSNSWSLPHELTIKVFSMLDTKSQMLASACCTMFKRCAMDPLCYSHIDLTSVNVNDEVVCRMTLTAGKELRSLKVGCPRSILTGSCLATLSCNNGFLGNLLRSLHLYNHRWLDNNSLCIALSLCSNLTDLKIVGLNIDSLDKVLDLLTRKCQHLFLEKVIGLARSCFISGWSFQRNCPNITSLSLIGFELSDRKAYVLIMGLRKLKYMNLSRTSGIEGRFLRDVSLEFKDSQLETLILRDCFELAETNVCRFLDSLLIGHLRFVRHIDISNNRGLICRGRRCYTPKFPLKKLNEERPDLTLVAHFGSPLSSSSSSSSSSSYSSSSSSSRYTSSGSAWN